MIGASVTEVPRGLPRVVRSFGAVSFLNDLASEMVYPLLPALVTRTLGGGAVVLGAIDGVADAVGAATKVIAGRLADRQSRRGPLIVVGYALAAVVRPMIAVVGAAWQVVVLRGADRLGKGLRTPARDAVIADATAPALHGRAFGYHRGMDHAGAMLGPLVAALLLGPMALHPEDVIAWSAVPGVIAVAVAWWAMRSLPTAPPPAPDREAHEGAKSAYVGLAVAAAFVRLPETLFLLRLQDLDVPVTWIAVLWAGLHVVRSAASYPGGRLSDHLGPGRTLVAGWILYVAIAFALARAGSASAGAAVFLGFGLVAALTESPERALVAAWAGRARRGRRFGVYHGAIGAVALPGALALGMVYDRLGGAAALEVSGVATGILALGALARLRRAA